MKAQQIVFTIILVLAVGAAAFWGGIEYQKGKTPMMGRGAQAGLQGRNGGQGRFGGRNGETGARGQVISSNDNGITVKLPDGSSKIVIISSGTQVGKQQPAAKSDIQNGDTVMVFGTANSDGSINAQSVQINPPQFRPSASPAAQ